MNDANGLNRAGIMAILLCVACFANLSVGQIVYSSELISPTPGPLEEYFGGSVALGSSYLVIGSEFSDDVGTQSGGVSVHSRATGAFLRKLTPPTHSLSDLFGSSVAIQGNTIVAGARLDSVSGRAFLFDAATGNWLRTLRPSDPTVARNFGIEVAIHGDIILVGCTGVPNADGTLGSVYVYSLSVPTDNEILKLRPDFFMGDDLFGRSLALNDDYVVVGAVNDDSPGAVYVFDVATGARLHRLVPDGSTAEPRFGRAVDIVQNLVIVGAPDDSSQAIFGGAVYLFDVATGQQLFKITPSELRLQDRFGSSVAGSANALMVGAPGDNFFRGSVYVLAGPDLEIVDIYTPGGLGPSSLFGSSLSIDGAEALVGAPRVSPNPGAAYLIFPRCAADLNEDGAVDFFDVSFFINFMIDYNEDGTFNFFDVSAFINDFNSGCP